MSYTLNDIEYPAVSTILGQLHKPALVQWSANCAVDHIENNLEVITHPKGSHSIDELMSQARKAHREVSKKALDIGTQVHDLIEGYVKHGLDPAGDIQENVMNGFLAFLEWEQLNNVEWIESEKTVFNTEIGYAGTLDVVAIINDVKYMIDFKTSKAIYPDYRTQLSAYMGAYTGDAERLAVLRLDKETGEPEFKDMTKNSDKSFTAFKILVDYYYASAKRKLKNNPFVAVYHGKVK